MSLILDALKKSDAERSRRRAPEAAAALTPVRDRSARRWWIPIAILLAINALGVAWLVGRSMSEPAPVSMPEATAPESTRLARAPAATPSPPQQTTPVRDSRIERLSDQTSRTQPDSSASDTAPVVESTEASVAQTPTSGPVIFENEQTYADYVAQTGNSFGDLSISLHVYDPQPGRRFAFVDGRKVTEGDRLANDLMVAEITPAGIVFVFASDRFLVRRD